MPLRINRSAVRIFALPSLSDVSAFGEIPNPGPPCLPSLLFSFSLFLKMVYYIRFLKTPKYQLTKGQVNIKAFITVTTDLGDDFYPDQLALTTSIYNGASGDRIPPILISSHESDWRQGMRGFPIDISLNLKEPKYPLELRMHCKASTAEETQSLVSASIPEVISIWSDIIDAAVLEPASRRVERRFSLGDDFCLSIWEEAGESIARHLWVRTLCS